MCESRQSPPPRKEEARRRRYFLLSSTTTAAINSQMCKTHTVLRPSDIDPSRTSYRYSVYRPYTGIMCTSTLVLCPRVRHLPATYARATSHGSVGIIYRNKRSASLVPITGNGYVINIHGYIGAVYNGRPFLYELTF